MQMAILNIYHKAPLTPVPGWLKRVQRYLTWRCGNTRVEDIPENLKRESTKGTLTIADMEDETQSENPNNGYDGVPAEVCKKESKVMHCPSEEALREEWQTVARMMDKIFFIIFISLQIALIVGTFGVIPCM